MCEALGLILNPSNKEKNYKKTFKIFRLSQSTNLAVYKLILA
jgi:hypothetical protein